MWIFCVRSSVARWNPEASKPLPANESSKATTEYNQAHWAQSVAHVYKAHTAFHQLPQKIDFHCRDKSKFWGLRYPGNTNWNLHMVPQKRHLNSPPVHIYILYTLDKLPAHFRLIIKMFFLLDDDCIGDVFKLCRSFSWYQENKIWNEKV